MAHPNPVLAKYNCSPSVEERFWAKVKRVDGCWIWTAHRHDFGYGKIGLGYTSKNSEYAHRLSWMIHNGDIPDGLSVLHKCDNPACVNPAHLYLGTQADNVRDMYARNRWHLKKSRAGEHNSKHKLTKYQVGRIRAMKGVPGVLVAKVWNVSPCTVSSIRLNKTWKVN